MLSYVLDRKEAFQDNKDVNFVKSKKWVLAKGVKPKCVGEPWRGNVWEVFYASSSQIDVTVIRRLRLLPDSF